MELSTLGQSPCIQFKYKILCSYNIPTVGVTVAVPCSVYTITRTAVVNQRFVFVDKQNPTDYYDVCRILKMYTTYKPYLQTIIMWALRIRDIILHRQRLCFVSWKIYTCNLTGEILCICEEKKMIFFCFYYLFLIFFPALFGIQYPRIQYNKLATLRYDGQNGFVMCVQ